MSSETCFPLKSFFTYPLPLNPKLVVSVKGQCENHSLFVEVDPVMMHATSITSASLVFPVFADAAVAVAHVAPKFPGLP